MKRLLRLLGWWGRRGSRGALLEPWDTEWDALSDRVDAYWEHRDARWHWSAGAVVCRCGYTTFAESRRDALHLLVVHVRTQPSGRPEGWPC